MAYDPTLATPRDRVRLLLGDTDGSAELLKDEEIAALLAIDPNPHLAAAAGADAIAAQFARKADTALPGGVRIAFSQRVDHFLRLADRLRAAAADTALPVNAALAEGDAADSQGVFSIGMHDADPTE